MPWRSNVIPFGVLGKIGHIIMEGSSVCYSLYCKGLCHVSLVVLVL